VGHFFLFIYLLIYWFIVCWCGRRFCPAEARARQAWRLRRRIPFPLPKRGWLGRPAVLCDLGVRGVILTVLPAPAPAPAPVPVPAPAPTLAPCPGTMPRHHAPAPCPGTMPWHHGPAPWPCPVPLTSPPLPYPALSPPLAEPGGCQQGQVR
jgi:hypothetical protein